MRSPQDAPHDNVVATLQCEEHEAVSDTNAVKWLRAQNADFKVLEYEFTEVGADKAAAAVNRPLEMVCKSLVIKATGNAYYFAIIPGDQRLDPRRLAAALNVQHADNAPPAEAEKVTGYRVGGISPFAARRHLPVLIEESLLALDTIIVNGGRQGVLLEMPTESLVQLLDATPADLCRA
jgi:Cys-tRNA(Pro)/Cys-tRNA(Cys) deacylase